MAKLRSTQTNEITVIYLSGNPACGKSEIARQIGETFSHVIIIIKIIIIMLYFYSAISICSMALYKN
jgi:uridine kinase